MDHEQPTAIDHADVYFTCPSPAEIERLIARGRALRAETVADLAKAATAALRRAFGHVSAIVNGNASDLRPHAH